MKRFSSTWIFLLFTAAIGGYAIWEFKQSKSEVETKAAENRIYNFKPGDVTWFKVTRDSDLLEVKKDGVWTIAQPVQDITDESMVNSYLTSLFEQKATEVKPEGQLQWAQFGLDKPGATIEFTASGATYKLEVSRTNAYDGSYYLRKDDKLWLGSTAWSHLVNESTKDVRDRRIYRETLSPQTIVIARRGKGQTKLSKKDGVWSIEGQTFPLDQSKISTYQSEFTTLRAQEFMAESKDKATLNKFGLAQPAAEVTVTFEGEPATQWKLSLSEVKGEDAYVFNSRRDTVFKIAKLSAEKMMKSAEDFRDDKAPFQFPLEQVSRAEIKAKGVDLVLTKENDWQLEKADDKSEMDREQLTQLFSKIHALEAAQYLPKGDKGKGLAPAKNSIVLKNKDNAVVFELAWGEEFKKKVSAAGNEDHFYYVKATGHPQVLGVRKSSLDELPVDKIKKAKVAEEKQSQAQDGAKKDKHL